MSTGDYNYDGAIAVVVLLVAALVLGTVSYSRGFEAGRGAVCRAICGEASRAEYDDLCSCPEDEPTEVG